MAGREKCRSQCIWRAVREKSTTRFPKHLIHALFNSRHHICLLVCLEYRVCRFYGHKLMTLADKRCFTVDSDPRQ